MLQTLHNAIYTNVLSSHVFGGPRGNALFGGTCVVGCCVFLVNLLGFRCFTDGGWRHSW